MFFVPFEYFEIYTSLNPDDVIQRLSTVIEPWHLFSSSTNKYFFGRVFNNHFKMTRKIWYRNSSLPVILGEIQPDRKGSRIKVSMRLHWPALVFSICALGVLGVITLNGLSSWTASVWQMGSNDVYIVFPSLGAFIFVYLLVLTPFKIEAWIARKMLLVV